MGNSIRHSRKAGSRRREANDRKSPDRVQEDKGRHAGGEGAPPKTRGSNIIPPKRSPGDDVFPRTSGNYNSQQRICADDIMFPLEDEALLKDPDMATFDDGVKQRTKKVLGILERGMKSGGLELSSLKDVTSGLMEMDQDVVNFILECDLDVWADDEMKELVTQYFDHSLEALDFCGVLEKSVQQARDNQMIIESAIRNMPESRDPNGEECQKILHELDLFVHAENPFSRDFADLFTRVYSRQKQLQVKLSEKKRHMHRKDRSVQMVRKLTTVILTATCVCLVICAAVAMAVAAPAFTTLSVSEAGALPGEAFHGWLRSLWSKYEQKIKVERGVIDATNWGTWVAIKDMDTINTEARRLNGELEGIVRNFQFGKERGDLLAVQQSVEVIKRKQLQLVQQLDDLSLHVNDCVRRISKARTNLLEVILGHPDKA